MLSSPPSWHRESRLSLRSTKRPEPNRALSNKENSDGDKLRKLIQTPTPPASASPPPLQGKNRLTRVQWESAHRKLAQFVRAIPIQPLPVPSSVRLSSDFALPRSPVPSPSPSPDPNSSNQRLDDISKQIKNLLLGEDVPESIFMPTGLGAHSPRSPASYFGSSSTPSPSSGPYDTLHSYSHGYSAFSHVADGREMDESPQSLLGSFCLPPELLAKIVGYIEAPKERMALSRVCKTLRKQALAETVWRPVLRRVASECDIEEVLLRRNDTTPSYLLFHAVLRWRDLYLEMKQLLKTMEPPQVQEFADERARFELLFEKMMPGVTPWESTNYIDEEVVLRLPSTITVLPSKNVKSIEVFIQLEHGAHKHELEKRGLNPILHFYVYEPTGDHPVINLQSPDIWHPLLNPTTNQLCLDIHRHTHIGGCQTSSAEAIRAIVLQIQEAFTNLSSIASDFTL